MSTKLSVICSPPDSGPLGGRSEVIERPSSSISGAGAAEDLDGAWPADEAVGLGRRGVVGASDGRPVGVLLPGVTVFGAEGGGALPPS